MPNAMMAPAGAATFIVPRIRLRPGSVGWTQIAGSSGSFESGAVPYSASISSACESRDGAGRGLVESSSGGAGVRRQLDADTSRTNDSSATRATAPGHALPKDFSASTPNCQRPIPKSRPIGSWELEVGNYQAAFFSGRQNLNFNPSWITRGPPRVRVIWPKFAAAMSRPGLRKVGVLVTLYASIRNSSERFSIRVTLARL